MKALTLILITLFTTQSVMAKKIDLRKKRVAGIKVNYANTLLLEQAARQNGEGNLNTEKILVTMYCYKKWKVRGRDSTLTYQCDPVEMEVPAPENP